MSGSLGSPAPRTPPTFDHFRARHLLADVAQTIRGTGVQPGELAPDFELRRVDGGTFRLSDLPGRPVLLHFGSFT